MPQIIVLLLFALTLGCVHKEVDKCSGSNVPAECPQCTGDAPDSSCANYVAPSDMGGDTSMPDDMGPGDMGPGDMGSDADPVACDPACEAPTGICNEGVCVNCVTTEDCGPSLFCDPSSNICQPCYEDSHCPDGVCDVMLHQCVQCKENSHCTDGVCDTTADVCVACLADTDCTDGRCLVDPADSANNACVACLDLNDCTDPAASRCGASNTCEACVDDADCADISNRCSAGVCVECTIATEATDCAGKSCDPATNACTTTDVGSVGVCEACVADSECETDYGCVPMNFDNMALGGFCLKNSTAANCTAPFSEGLSRTSLSGSNATWCALDETLTTCAAVLEFGATCTDDADCGINGVADLSLIHI